MGALPEENGAKADKDRERHVRVGAECLEVEGGVHDDEHEHERETGRIGEAAQQLAESGDEREHEQPVLHVHECRVELPHESERRAFECCCEWRVVGVRNSRVVERGAQAVEVDDRFSLRCPEREGVPARHRLERAAHDHYPGYDDCWSRDPAKPFGCGHPRPSGAGAMPVDDREDEDRHARGNCYLDAVEGEARDEQDAADHAGPGCADEVGKPDPAAETLPGEDHLVSRRTPAPASKRSALRNSSPRNSPSIIDQHNRRFARMDEPDRPVRAPRRGCCPHRTSQRASAAPT